MKRVFANFSFAFGFAGLLVASWILLHILAVCGIFLALLYPLWWLILPKYNWCLVCRVTPEGKCCPFCQRYVNHLNRYYRISLRSAIYNSSLILAISLFSIGIVLAESKVLAFAGFGSTASNAVFQINSKGQYQIGQIFPMTMTLTNIKRPINAVQADIEFDPKMLQIIKISTTTSFANIFIQKDINNTTGYARITGGVPNPGWSGNKGVFATVYFLTKAPGLTTVSYLPSSLVLANDGKATNILNNLSSASYLILPETISKAESEKQQKLLAQRVLGASTTSTQLDFTDNEETLDDTVLPDIHYTQPLHEILLSNIEHIDARILTFWRSL